MPTKLTPDIRRKAKTFAYLPAIAACLFSVPSSAAQDLLGTWHGALANTVSADSRRTLTVSERDGQLTCTFDVTGTIAPAEAKCAISDGALELTTALNNVVRLVRSGDVLQGMLAVSATPSPLRLRMTRDGPGGSTTGDAPATK